MSQARCEHGRLIYKDGYYICEFCGHMLSESEMIELAQSYREGDELCQVE